MQGICRNCNHPKALRRSHAIPNSFFKPLARGGSGQFVELSDGPSKARASQESGQDYLLCSKCEGIFSEQFDKPIAEEVRRLRAAFSNRLTEIESDVERIKSGIASIVWRASISNARLFKSFKIPSGSYSDVVSEMRIDRREERRFSYSMRPIYDPTLKEDGGFDTAALENFIVTPKPWGIAHGYGGRRKEGWGAILLMGGVVVTMHQPRLSPYKERQRFYLPTNRLKSPVRPTDMWSVPHLREFLAFVVHKEKSNTNPTDISPPRPRSR